MSLIENFLVEKPQSNIVFFNCVNDYEYKLDLEKTEIILLGKKGQRLIGGDIADILNNPSCRDATSSAFNMIETKRTCIINNNLLYVECKPLYYGNTPNDLYAVLLMTIPYKYYDKKVKLHLRHKQENQSIKTNVKRFFNCRKAKGDGHDTKELHTPYQNDTNIRIESISTFFNFATNVSDYKLDVGHTQCWIFDTNSNCVYSTVDDSTNIVKKHIMELKPYIDDVDIWNKIISEALDLHETKKTILSKNRMIYLEAKPLFYNNKQEEIYGVIIVFVPYCVIQ